MLDYGRRLEFGISISPEAASVAQARALVVAADATGVDLVGIQDHPYQRRFLDTLTLIGNLLAVTERIRIFPDVANLPLRPPATLAKQAASLDLLSGGRFELGLGAGGFWEAILAMGGPRRSPGESVEALAEAIQIIRQAWSDTAAVRFGGRYYQAAGYRPGPAPAHAIEIWIGAYRPRMLRLIGRLADGWIPSLGNLALEQLDGLHAIIDGAAQAADRDPATIRRLLNFGGQIGMVPAGEGGLGSLGGEALSGSVDEWVARLAGWATEHGIDTFMAAAPRAGAGRALGQRDCAARQGRGRPAAGGALQPLGGTLGAAERPSVRCISFGRVLRPLRPPTLKTLSLGARRVPRRGRPLTFS